LALARRTSDPEVRKELEDLARSCLAEVESIEETKN
jgi:hypothetical protein